MCYYTIDTWESCVSRYWNWKFLRNWNCKTLSPFWLSFLHVRGSLLFQFFGGKVTEISRVQWVAWAFFPNFCLFSPSITFAWIVVSLWRGSLNVLEKFCCSRLDIVHYKLQYINFMTWYHNDYLYKCYGCYQNSTSGIFVHCECHL